MSNQLFVISGISGSGKTTLGRELAKRLNLLFVDEDDYYLNKKPKIKLSNGDQRSNWDCVEAINPNFMQEIEKLLQNRPVLLVGFALPKYLLPQKVRVHIHLKIADNPRDLEERCLQARHQAKPFVKLEQDRFMVKEVVIPFYHEMVCNSDITHLLKVFKDDGTRVPLAQLIDSGLEIITQSEDLES